MRQAPPFLKFRKHFHKLTSPSVAGKNLAQRRRRRHYQPTTSTRRTPHPLKNATFTSLDAREPPKNMKNHSTAVFPLTVYQNSANFHNPKALFHRQNCTKTQLTRENLRPISNKIHQRRRGPVGCRVGLARSVSPTHTSVHKRLTVARLPDKLQIVCFQAALPARKIMKREHSG